MPITQRFQDAIGAMPLASATSHVPKNGIVGLRKKGRRYAIVGLTAATLTFGTAGCGNTPADHTQATPSRSGVTTVVAPSSPATLANVTEPAPVIAKVTVPAAVVKQFGQAKAEAGYEQVAKFTTDMAFPPALVGKRDGFTVADFAATRDQQTASSLRDWDTSVAKAVAGDQKARNVVLTLTYYNLDPTDVFPTDGSLVQEQSISKPALAVDDSGKKARLKASFTHHGVLEATFKGMPATWNVTKTCTYWLVPAPAGSKYQWLIDGWKADYTGKGTHTEK